MGLRIFINDANGAVSATPLGGAIAELSSPIDIYNVNTLVQWQFGSADLQGIYRPLRKDTASTTTFKWDFLPLNTFTGTATFGLDPSTIVRPPAGTGTGYLINEGPGYAVGARSLILDTGSGTILAGDYVDIGHFEYLVETGISSPGTIILQSPGLREVIPDNTPLFINFEAGFYTAVLQADTTGSAALLSAAPTHDAVPVFSGLTWFDPADDPTGPPRTSARTYATLLNTFASSGVTPSASGPGSVFLAVLTGTTGGGGTNLDGLTTVGKGYNVVTFVDATRGLVSYQLRAGTDATSAPAIVRAAEYATSTYQFVWYSIS